MDISDNLGVYVCGKQYPDASEAREIHMEGPDVLTSSQARQLGLTKLLRLPPAPLVAGRLRSTSCDGSVRSAA